MLTELQSRQLKMLLTNTNNCQSQIEKYISENVSSKGQLYFFLMRYCGYTNDEISKIKVKHLLKNVINLSKEPDYELNESVCLSSTKVTNARRTLIDDVVEGLSIDDYIFFIRAKVPDENQAIHSYSYKKYFKNALIDAGLTELSTYDFLCCYMYDYLVLCAGNATRLRKHLRGKHYHVMKQVVGLYDGTDVPDLRPTIHKLIDIYKDLPTINNLMKDPSIHAKIKSVIESVNNLSSYINKTE